MGLAKAKAEISFEQKVAKAIDERDWDRVTQVTTWYESYRNLVAEAEDEGAPVVDEIKSELVTYLESVREIFEGLDKLLQEQS